MKNEVCFLIGPLTVVNQLIESAKTLRFKIGFSRFFKYAVELEILAEISDILHIKIVYLVGGVNLRSSTLTSPSGI